MAHALGLAGTAEVCKLVPEQEQGPFYVAGEMLRSNIREDKPGVSLTIHLIVLDSRTCMPLPHAAIDLWHCDAMGLYSGYTSNNPMGGPGGGGPGGPEGHEGPGGPPPDFARDNSGPPPGSPPDGFGPPPGGAPKPTDKLTFLRGIQITDRKGAVHFETIVPGFYMGRTNHVHFKVRLGGHPDDGNGRQTYAAGHTAHIGQMFFPEDLVTGLMKYEPYSRHQIHRTTQVEDGVYSRQHGNEVIATVTSDEQSHVRGGLSANLIVAVDPTATPSPVGAGGFRPKKS